MKRLLAIAALLLGLGYAVSLVPLPWTTDSIGVEATFVRESWFLSLALLLFNLLWAFLLFHLKKNWSILALSFCSVQVVIWWLLSGLLAVDESLLKFMDRKADAIQMLLKYADFKVVFVTVHQDILVGVFYHLALLWLVINVLVSLYNRAQIRTTISTQHDC